MTAAAEVVHRSGGRCEAYGSRLGEGAHAFGDRCQALAVHVHHRKMRSQGGPDTGANLVHLCGPCHRWAHDNPAAAYECGLLIRGSAPDPVTPYGWPR